MASSNLLTILHISDFHFAKRKQREQAIIVQALAADLKTLCIGHRKPDLIVFTGDLVQTGGVDSHDDAYDFVIDTVSKATGCSDERIFIVPGNHDFSWSALDSHADDHRAWRDILGKSDEMEQLNALYERGAFNAAVSDKFSNFLDLEHYLSGYKASDSRKLRTAFATVDHIETLEVDLVSINTAALSTGGHKAFKPDDRQLAVPEYAVMEAISVLKTGTLRLFATHHPFSMLSEQTARYLEGEIAKHGDIHLFGHMHDPQPKKTVGLKGEFLSDQAGALFTTRRNTYNGYSLITIDRSKGYVETLVRSYYKERNEFDEGVDVIEGGRWWSSQEAREHFRRIAAPVDETKFRAHLSGSALNALRTRETCTGGEGDLHDRFVAPPLHRTFIREVAADTDRVDIETPISFEDVVGGDANLILYAKAEYGRTTLLRELRYKSLAQANEIRFPRLPILIDFADIASNADNMLRKVRGGSEAAPPGNDVESLLKLGHASMLIDDVQFEDGRRMKILRDFVARFPKARYILSSPLSSATQVGASIDPEMPVRFEFVEVREFRRNDMRQLLAKDERCTNVEEWLDRLQTEFREINLPFIAANGSILIEILSEKHNFTPINRAVLMEQFIDSTLRKAAIEQSRRETFDYTNKTHLLSHIAAWMATSENYVPTKEAVRAEMKEYVDARGLNVALDELLHEFLTARIFIGRSDGRISFRYRGVLEYFIALRMTIDEIFKAWVMEEDRYLSYVNEIQYYAGKLRNDKDLVDLIGERHNYIFTHALGDIGDAQLSQLESIQVPNDTADVEALAEDIGSAPLSAEQKDSELEAQVPRDAVDRQEVYRPSPDEIADGVMLSLILYSGVIKNMELISDADKRRHLSAIWRGWSSMLVVALRIVPRIAKERRVRINGALYEVQAPFGMSNSTLLKHMMLRLPHVHVRAISSTLGTEKLERQLTEPNLEEEAEPKIYDFLRTGLIADLGLTATPGAVDALATRLKNNHYLLWCLIVHVSELRRLDRVKEEHFQALEEPLAGAIANLRGGTHKARAEEKRRQMARLGKDRLMLTMQRDKGDPGE
jgi:predicted MPP superfamily phosphohydrolase